MSLSPLRPGVYPDAGQSRILPLYPGRKGGLVFLSEEGDAMTPLSFSSSEGVGQVFASPPLLAAAKLFFLNGGSSLTVLTVPSEEGLEEGFSLLSAQAEVLMDIEGSPLSLHALKRTLENFVPKTGCLVGLGGLPEEADDLPALTSSLRCGRLALLPLPAVAAVGGRVCGHADILQPLQSLSLRGLDTLTPLHSEEEIGNLLALGVSPLERNAGELQVVRLVSTQTAANGAEDNSLLPLNAAMLRDEVVAGVFRALSEGAAKQPGGLTRDGVDSLVFLMLFDNLEAGWISSYLPPSIQPNGEGGLTVTLSFVCPSFPNQSKVVAQLCI